MAVLTINGKEMPCPSEMKWTISAFDLDSGRNVDGDMIRNLVCQKERLDLSFNSANLTPQEISTLLKAIMPPFIQVTYHSPLEGAIVTKTMYSSDRDINIYSAIAGQNVVADSISFALIEK